MIYIVAGHYRQAEYFAKHILGLPYRHWAHVNDPHSLRGVRIGMPILLVGSYRTLPTIVELEDLFVTYRLQRLEVDLDRIR